jgi:hypothetical protein
MKETEKENVLLCRNKKRYFLVTNNYSRILQQLKNPIIDEVASTLLRIPIPWDMKSTSLKLPRQVIFEVHKTAGSQLG